MCVEPAYDSTLAKGMADGIFIFPGACGCPGAVQCVLCSPFGEIQGSKFKIQYKEKRAPHGVDVGSKNQRRFLFFLTNCIVIQD